jgi:hypothetical protein
MPEIWKCHCGALNKHTSMHCFKCNATQTSDSYKIEAPKEDFVYPAYGAPKEAPYSIPAYKAPPANPYPSYGGGGGGYPDIQSPGMGMGMGGGGAIAPYPSIALRASISKAKAICQACGKTND